MVILFLLLIRTAHPINMQFFLLVATVNNAENYLPIVLQAIFSIGLIVTIIIGP